ncbi:DUF3558 domain-containing protein [Gordonia desulfuricans]|uniref:DUF3558 domain-containing protein n=1 Tax=Gordonia desulfuricans TaxID=89051 RepID=A0A7K3LJN6_9ACTN|nr:MULTISPECIES: DUF3558 domain-containing protein [Gordonia]EMP10938.2 hypothetical protein ISGA_5105 [Gordonia sp. NB41Y]NDK88456.1 DUF3558 domain-containing protein [Gordonia desulfuricans]WLP92013.1 DUF3558 domain-containing protein [Gordonia sp. NB41Y]
MRGSCRPAVWLAILAVIVAVLAGCARDVDGDAVAVGQGGQNTSGNVDTDQYDQLTLECQILSDAQIAKAVGGTSASSTFNGAICRWIVDGPVAANVTFNWFEWGNLNVEKDTGKKLGYVTENVKVVGQAAFTQRDPRRPNVCGVTTRAPSRGVFTFWVEPIGGSASADPCAAPTKLMELVLNGGQ